MHTEGKSTSLRSEDGQGLVEFALVLPLLLIVAFGIFDFGRAINYWMDETHLANQAARFAAVNRVPAACGGSSLPDCMVAQGTTRGLREGSNQVTSPLQVCVSYPNGPVVGEVVEVTAKARFRFLSPVLNIAIPEREISGQARMRLEARPDDIPEECS